MADNTTLNTGTGGDVIASDDVTTLNGGASSGVKVQRVKVMFGDDNTARDASAAFPLPVHHVNSSRTFIQLFANAAAAGATGVETAITLTRSGSPGAATTTGSSFVPTSGKRFRITSITFASRGNTTATAQITTFSLRVNSAGAVATTSAAMLSAATATPATALAWDRVSFQFGDDGPEIAGDGTLQFGLTANAVFTTNAPTWFAAITGYEY
jgi:hypothetical protein